MEEWKEYRLGDFMEFNPKISLKKDTVARIQEIYTLGLMSHILEALNSKMVIPLWPGLPPVLKMGNMRSFRC